MPDASPENGIVSIPANKPVSEVVNSLERLLAEKEVKLFAIVDHSGEASEAGLEMRNTKLLIFGNPRAGTPLMVAQPTIALDLPLKILVSEDGTGQVWITYNSPAYLTKRHGLSPDLASPLSVVEALAANTSRSA